MKTNWPTKKIGEVCNTVQKVKPSDIYSDYFPYIDISAVNSKTKTLKRPFRLNVGGAPGRARQLVHTGDVIFATTRPYLENIASIDEQHDKAIASTGFCVMSPNRDLINPNYLFLLVSSKDFINKILIHQKGATYPIVSDKDIFNIKIPLPPLTEQKKIVVKLEKLLAKVDEAKKLRAQAQKSAGELLPAELYKIFEEGKKKGWEEKSFDQVCKQLFAGGDVPKNFSKEKTKKFTIPIYSNGIKNKGLYGFTDTEKVNEIAVTISGRGTIGYSEIRREPFYPAIRLIVLVPNKDILDVEFLKYISQNIDFHNAGTSIPQLTVPMVKNRKILIPPLKEQKEIVARLDSISEKAKRLQELQETISDELIALEQSILSKAFTGELV